MKKSILILFCIISYAVSQAQSDSASHWFKKDHLFTGGGITLNFFNNQFSVGATPVIGYRLTKWIDVGFLFNFLYVNEKNINNASITGKQTVLGPGAFARIYPVRFLFVQGQYEQNYVNYKFIYPNSPSEKFKFKPSSVLVGAGYCQGRENSDDMFYYISLMFDVTKDKYSPYVQVNSIGDVYAVPIIRAGLQIPLFTGKSLF